MALLLSPAHIVYSQVCSPDIAVMMKNYHGGGENDFVRNIMK